MKTKLIDGKAVSSALREGLKEKCAKLRAETGVIPGLAVILVGNDPGSRAYVNQKGKACKELGYTSKMFYLSSDTSQDELLALIEALNADNSVHGILVQLPLPKHIDETEIIHAIDKDKDVDAFHRYNVGGIMTGHYDFLPCTPAGIMKLLEAYDINIEGKDCVIVGRSNIVGKPMAMLMLHANATVTICHTKTKDLAQKCKNADILIVAAGKQGLITGDMVKEGAVVIDVGTNRGEDGKLHGDVDTESVMGIASYVTPVPGGVGPMTVTMLMKNTLTAAKNYAKRAK